MLISLKPLLSVVGGGVLTVLVLSGLGLSVGLALLAGMFPVVAYLMRRPLLESLDDARSGATWIIVVWCVFALGVTRLAVGVLEWKVIDCCKPGIFYSEKECALREARREVLDRYDSGDWEPPDW